MTGTTAAAAPTMDDVTESILHVDMDAFYASVEALKDPTIAGRPVIVGGQGNRGVVTSASYEARAFGVHSAMPMITARRLCPHAVFAPNDLAVYQRYSRAIRDIFDSFTPLVEPLSLDEAFLDVAGSVRLFGPPIEIARRIKRRITAVELGCTVGIAPNKFLAKLASTRAKPDGLLRVPADGIEEFLHPLPVEALWGVGEQTAAALRRLGLKTVGDIARISARTLERAVGDAVGAHLHALARGVDDRPVVPNEPAKQVSSEETFERDLDSSVDVLREILRLSDRTAARLRRAGLCARTVTLKVRFSNFKTITRSVTLDERFDTAPEIYEAARALYVRLDPDRPRIRLLGVAASGLAPGPPTRQLGLPTATRRPRWEDASRAIDDIRTRWGTEAVAPATLLEGDGPVESTGSYNRR